MEGSTLEWKREYTEDIRKTVIAFANSDGGRILIGVSDDGSTYGVTNEDELLRQVTSSIRDTISPDVTLFTECRKELLDQKSVIVIQVQRGTARPYYLSRKGIRPEGVYVRQGSSTVPASEAAILAMIRDTTGDSYEEARSLQQNLTFHKTASYFQRKNTEFGDAQKRSLHLIGLDGEYTNLGFLLSDQCSHTVKIAVYEGALKTIFRDRLELDGSLLYQLENAHEFIDRYNRIRSEFSGLERIDLRDYPEEAIREALLNAIVHRDYAYSSSTLISIFDDRIEFVTIGGLVKDITFDDVELGVSALRNPNLANVFYRLRLIEAYGTGLLKIRSAYTDHDLKPQIRVSEHAFKVTLPNTNFRHESSAASSTYRKTGSPPSPMDLREQTLVYKLRESKAAYTTRRDIEETLGISQASAILLLREMTQRGTLMKEGSGKLSKYRLR